MLTHMVRWIGGLLATLVMLVLVVSPVGAHAELESSDPPDGATLSSAPASLSFTFGEDVLPEGNAVTLTDVAADSRLELGPVQVNGDTVSVTWPGSSPAGEFRAAYRVVSADGHPINGTITFTVQEEVGAEEATAAPGSAGPGPASASPSAQASAGPAPAEDDADAGLLVWVLGIGLAVLVGAGGGAWVMRRTR